MAELKKESGGFFSGSVTEDYWDKGIVYDGLHLWNKQNPPRGNSPEDYEKEKAIQDMLARRNDYPIIGGSDTEKKVFEMQRAERQLQDEEAKKVRKKYIIYGLIAVAGYFAYKKFKK
tara:strand:+ start:363 stop:713 length:351 start_codon:yes stop_codon:yes gene_type:complete